MTQEASRNPTAKAMEVLRWIVDQEADDWGVRELATSLSMQPSTVHRSLVLLEQEGFVEHEPRSGRYRLGLEFLRLARRAVSHYPVWKSALPHLRQLVDECNETALLMLYDRNRLAAIVAESVESTHPVRYVQDLSDWLPIHAGATGLAILAFLPEPDRERVIKVRGLPRVTDATIVDRGTLARELDRIRRRGFATSKGQRVPGAASIAAPFFDSSGVAGDVALTIPEYRFRDDAIDRLGAAVLGCADKITKVMDGRPPPRPGSP